MDLFRFLKMSVLTSFIWDYGGMVRKSDYNMDLNKTRSKKSRNDCNWRPWSELLEDILNLILKKLVLMDCFAFGGVCRRWRALVALYKQENMAYQPPLVVIISKYAKKTCFFHNIFDGKTYKTTLPYFADKTCLGFSSGYLIMKDRGQRLWVVNPITRYKGCLSPPPFLADSFILVPSSMPSTDLLVVALTRSHQDLQFRRFRDVSWTVLSFAGEPGIVADVAVFKGKVYFLTEHARVGILSLRSRPRCRVLEVKGTPSLSTELKLIASDDKLMVFDASDFFQIKLYELNFSRMEWLKVESLGDQALFIDYWNGAGLFNNPTMWGGRSNCVYSIGLDGKCYSCSLNGRFYGSFPIAERDGASTTSIIWPFWYFPHQCHRADSLYE